jgi:antitoxin component of MazEF toxin-antitoxin module
MNHVLEVQVDEKGDHFIVLPSDVLLAANINIGDEVEWNISNDNTYATLSKVKDI